MDYNLIGVFLCGAGTIQSLFLSIYLFVSRKIQQKHRLFLSLLFLLITIRLVKSIGWYFFSINNDIFLNIGFAAHAFIVPVLLIYIIKNVPKIELNARYHFLILLPPSMFLVGIPFLGLNSFWFSGGYSILLYLTIIYLVLCAYFLLKVQKENKGLFRLLSGLFIAITLFCLSYFANYILKTNGYLTGPILYAIIVYALSFYLFRNMSFLKSGNTLKYRNINLSKDEIETYSKTVKDIMELEKPYLNGNFNLSILSEKTKLPKHVLSSIFSTAFEQSFSDFTNAYRIKEAIRLLGEDAYKNQKIAAVAYDCGFNSVSAFNTSFKKINQCSPSEYKRQNL